MPAPSETLWEFEDHTKAKLSILKKYLEAWFPIMSNVCNKVFYIDGFAGPGEDKTHTVDGSPVVALKVAQIAAATFPGKLKFLFIEEDKDRLHRLEEIVSKLNLPGRFELKFEQGA
jgi:three-Cys-motif partner protein